MEKDPKHRREGRNELDWLAGLLVFRAESAVCSERWLIGDIAQEACRQTHWLTACVT